MKTVITQRLVSGALALVLTLGFFGFVVSDSSPIRVLPVWARATIYLIPAVTLAVIWILAPTRPRRWSARWRRVRSFDDLRDVMVLFIKGKEQRTPWHNGPLAPESASIRDQLLVLNRNGFVTDDSQPGMISAARKQRAYVSGLVHPSMAAALHDFAVTQGFVWAENRGERSYPEKTIPVVEGDGEVLRIGPVDLAFSLHDGDLFSAELRPTTSPRSEARV